MKRKNYLTGLLFIILICICGHIVSAQNNRIALDEPIVGKRCPEFTFDNIDFYSKTKVSLDDFKGKWLVIDFWSKNCSGCIASFPRVNKEQKELQDKVQFVMITYLDKENEHRQMYANFRKKLNLAMPSAFVETTFLDKWKVGTMPHVIVIDPTGIVVAVTGSPDIGDQLKALIAGQKPTFYGATYSDNRQNQDRFKYNIRLPLGGYGNGGVDSDFIFRSLLTKWNKNISARSIHSMIQNEYETKLRNGKGRFELVKVGISDLYFSAYTGIDRLNNDDTTLYEKVWHTPILEVKDTIPFHTDDLMRQGFFCYSMSVPPEKATRKYMMQVMQNDLENYFGYDVTVEDRKMPCWLLTANDAARKKLHTAGGKRSIHTQPGLRWQGLVYQNVNIRDIVLGIIFYGGVDNLPVINETGIQGNIDLTVNWFKGDFESVKEAIQRNGFDLVRGEKLMKVIVIHDPKPVTAQVNQTKIN